MCLVVQGDNCIIAYGIWLTDPDGAGGDDAVACLKLGSLSRSVLRNCDDLTSHKLEPTKINPQLVAVSSGGLPIATSIISCSKNGMIPILAVTQQELGILRNYINLVAMASNLLL